MQSSLDRTRRRHERALAAAVCLVGLGGVVAWVVANGYDHPAPLWACSGAVTHSSGATPTEALDAYLSEIREGNHDKWKLVENLKGSAAFERKDPATSRMRVVVYGEARVWRVGGTCI